MICVERARGYRILIVHWKISYIAHSPMIVYYFKLPTAVINGITPKEKTLKVSETVSPVLAY